MVENKIKNCLYCATITPMSSREPLSRTPLSNSPFQEISIDFATVNDTTLLIVVDDYPRYLLAEIVSSTSASATIPKWHGMLWAE